MNKIKKTKSNQEEYKSLSTATRNQIRAMLLDGVDVEEIAKAVNEPFYPAAAYIESAKCDDIRIITNNDSIKKDYFAGLDVSQIMDRYNIVNSGILQKYLSQVREQAVIDDLIAGSSVTEIANNYGISENLVAKYAYNTLSKMLKR